MRLDELIAAEQVGENAAIEIAGLAYDSRKVKAGDMYCCVVGLRSNGHEYAEQAIANGAVALVVERPLNLGVPEVVVRSGRAAMGPIAARFNGDPTGRLRVVGVTGTNGKTTTAFIVRALLEAAGVQTGLLGTVKSIVGGEERPVDRTTPEAIDLQREFREMLEAGDGACAMEVSSHALALGRTRGIRFGAAVFTNLTQDHLDYHATMEDYFQAKRLLFVPEEAEARPGVSVVNVGDPYGRRLAQELDGAITFAVDDEAEYRATDLRCDMSGCRFTLDTPVDRREVVLPMPGRFNVANALGALAAAHALTEAGRHRPFNEAGRHAPLARVPVSSSIPVSANDLDTLVAALERGVRVPGRFESVKEEGQEFAVIVDYAHTPDSLENVLHAARDIANGRVVCVFGAGGDRDRGKRPLMGEIASRLADVTIVTSDNPRSEDPEAIVAEIMAGVPSAVPGAQAREQVETVVHVEVDRRTAIEQAVALAEKDDVVVIAGKGHEQGQELADGVEVPFDDVTVVREVLNDRRSARITAVGAEE